MILILHNDNDYNIKLEYNNEHIMLPLSPTIVGYLRNHENVRKQDICVMWVLLSKYQMKSHINCRKPVFSIMNRLFPISFIVLSLHTLPPVGNGYF